MTLEEFKSTLAKPTPPTGVAPALIALWHDGRGNWADAHHVAQDIDDPSGAWVHAYLHRKEGDEANASYWYRRASRRPAAGALAEEWDTIVTTLLIERSGG